MIVKVRKISPWEWEVEINGKKYSIIEEEPFEEGYIYLINGDWGRIFDAFEDAFESLIQSEAEDEEN